VLGVECWVYISISSFAIKLGCVRRLYLTFCSMMMVMVFVPRRCLYVLQAFSFSRQNTSQAASEGQSVSVYAATFCSKIFNQMQRMMLQTLGSTTANDLSSSRVYNDILTASKTAWLQGLCKGLEGSVDQEDAGLAILCHTLSCRGTVRSTSWETEDVG